MLPKNISGKIRSLCDKKTFCKSFPASLSDDFIYADSADFCSSIRKIILIRFFKSLITMNRELANASSNQNFQIKHFYILKSHFIESTPVL